ncbi:MAG: hypothetical protein QOD76_923, partial [Solirubrobacteraceae bacterium]|nr:hypothetical protein [Solirubrobacteraceae bacterium]
MDVVVPFRGDATELAAVRQRMARLDLREDDSLLVVDNTPCAGPPGEIEGGEVPVLHAAGRRVPGYARNRGAA